MVQSEAVENPFQGAHSREAVIEPGNVEKLLEIVVALPFVATKARGMEERVFVTCDTTAACGRPDPVPGVVLICSTVCCIRCGS